MWPSKMFEVRGCFGETGASTADADHEPGCPNWQGGGGLDRAQ